MAVERGGKNLWYRRTRIKVVDRRAHLGYIEFRLWVGSDLQLYLRITPYSMAFLCGHMPEWTFGW